MEVILWEKNDDLRQNLFLEVKKPEIKETKGTFISPTFKSSYWGPFSGLKIHDFIKTSRTFPCVILCPRPFCPGVYSVLFLHFSFVFPSAPFL